MKSVVRPVGRPPAAVPDGTRVYAIGDIHGRADLLDQLHAKILEDAQTSNASRRVIVYLGDYVDRGLDSKGVIDRLLADPLPGFERVFLKGNHEDAFLKFFAEPEFGRDWKYYGGLETLMSYGVKALPLKDEPEAFVAARDELASNFPVAHLDFLGNLRLWLEEGDFYFAHAGVRPGRPLEQQTGQDLMWIRDDFLSSDMDFGKVIVHGHTPEEQPVQRANRIGIDTGAYITGILTCAVLEESDCRFIQIGA
ncbi:MAG: metallophosphoesterase family protein [Candidatus Phaeomarinobacter sp.]